MCRVAEARVAFREQPFARPLVLSTGVISSITEATAEVRAERGGRSAWGRGSVYLSDLWAWPEPSLSHKRRDAALRSLCVRLAAEAREWGGESAHPLELGLRLAGFSHNTLAEMDPPSLARSLCASPFDAALHDAAGRLLGVPSMELFGEEDVVPLADALFPENGAVRAVREALVPYRPDSCAWVVVGAADDLDRDLLPWICGRGYRAFKLKLCGRDEAADAGLTARVYRFARENGVAAPRLCGDSNGANTNPESVLRYIGLLEEADPEAFAALEYIEQPTGRDILQRPHSWHEVARRKPVFLDEGLTGLDVLGEARNQGWSGFALKTCKGHSVALVAAAWAIRNGMAITLQDLTNPGISAIHAALLASRLPTRNGVELNAAQFTPDANAPWLPRLQTLLEPADGTHRLPAAPPIGLGSDL